MITILLFKRPWEMSEPYIEMVNSSESECAVQTVVASYGKRLLRRKGYCKVEKTNVPQIELLHVRCDALFALVRPYSCMGRPCLCQVRLEVFYQDARAVPGSFGDDGRRSAHPTSSCISLIRV